MGFGPDGLPNANPVIPVYDFMGQGNLMNQGPNMNPMPQQHFNMPPAGLPTRQIPQFDPCTGRECQPATGQPGQSGAYGMPMTCMYPCFCPIQCYPCPQAMNVTPPMQQGFGPPNTTNQTNNFNANENNIDNGERVNKTNIKSSLKDSSDKSKDQR